MSWLQQMQSTNRERLVSIHLRFYPPCLILEVEKNNELTHREIELLSLDSTTDIDVLADHIISEESCLKPKYKGKLVSLLENMVKMQGIEYHSYKLKHIKSHDMPLTYCCFNKMGELYITASNDRKCRIWESGTGKELNVLEGHKNTVNICLFNNPVGDLILTGSADKTSMLWRTGDGEHLYTFDGHTGQVVNIKFDHGCHTVASASADSTCRLYDIETGEFNISLVGHSSEVANVEFSNDDDIVLTSSFDSTARIWDVRTGQEVLALSGHKGEIFASHFDWPCENVLTASMDGTANIWDLRICQPKKVMNAHSGGCTDANWSPDGRHIATAGADAVAKLYDAEGNEELSFIGHTGEINKVIFSPQSSRVLTASTDSKCKLWDVNTGLCVETLDNHAEEIMCAEFNYSGKWIITASHDNTVIQWEASETDYRC